MQVSIPQLGQEEGDRTPPHPVYLINAYYHRYSQVQSVLDDNLPLLDAFMLDNCNIAL